MWRTIILRNDMINMFSKSDWFISTSVAACAPSSAVTTVPFASRTVSHSIRFYWSFPVKSLKSFLSYKTHLRV